MSHGAPEQVIVLLVRDSEQRVEAVGCDVVLAVLPFHGLALPGGGHGADRLSHGPAGSGEQRHLHLLHGDGLVLDGIRGLNMQAA